MAWDVTNHDLSIIESPIEFDRTQWLNDISYTMWSFDELKEGMAWSHITSNQ